MMFQGHFLDKSESDSQYFEALHLQAAFVSNLFLSNTSPTLSKYAVLC